MTDLFPNFSQNIKNVLANCGHPDALKQTNTAEPLDMETWVNSFRYAPKLLQVKATQFACELLLPNQTDDPYNRPQKVLDAVKTWLENPTAEAKKYIRERTGAVEEIWNSWADDTNGAPHNVYQAAYYLGKTASEDSSRDVDHCLTAVTDELGEKARSYVNKNLIKFIMENQEMLNDAAGTSKYETAKELPPVVKSELARLIKLLNVQDAMTTSVLTALLENIHKHYPEPAKTTFHEPNAMIHARIPMAIGTNPIMLTQVYEKAGHECYVTFFLGPLIGYEMTFRVAKPTEPEQSQYLSLAQLKKQKNRPSTQKKDFLNLLINLTNNTLFQKEYYNDTPFYVKPMGDWFGNSIFALVFMNDPVLREVDTAAGTVKYTHAFGITQTEYDEYFNPKKVKKPDREKAGVRYIQQRYRNDPFMITEDK